MNHREMCAQMILADYRFDTPDYDRAIALAKEGVGGFCFFGGTIFDVAPIVNALQRHAKAPLLFCSDYEHGVGHQVSGATLLPSNLAVGATRSAELARKKAQVTAVEATALGVRWVLAPVLDCNGNPENPIINTRSFGQDPALVTKLAKAYLDGLHEKGAIGCGKHYPGHGDVTVDSHIDLPTLKSPEAEIGVYRSLYRDLDAIMTAHLLVSDVDAEHPASLSAKVTGALRKEYDGIICTDAIMMGAIKKKYPETESVALAAAAGADLICYPEDPMKAISTLEQTASPEVVKRASERVIALKRRMGLFENRKVDAGSVDRRVGIEAHRAIAQEIADASITRVKGDPVVPGNAFYVHVADVENVSGDLTVFEKHLTTGLGRMVIGVYFKQRAFSGKTGLPDHLVQRIVTSLKQDPEAVVVSFGSPYILRQVPDIKHYVCAYSESEFSQRAAAWAVQGKTEFKGTLPVTLA